jgi:hypothetical protein
MYNYNSFLMEQAEARLQTQRMRLAPILPPESSPYFVIDKDVMEAERKPSV